MESKRPDETAHVSDDLNQCIVRLIEDFFSLGAAHLVYIWYILANCGNPPCPANGMVTTDGGTTVGHVATYSCDDDYVLGYPGARICKPDGSWSGSTPTCDPVGKLKNTPYIILPFCCCCCSFFSEKERNEGRKNK